MKSRFWLLAGILLTGSVWAVPHYGPGPAPYMGRPGGAAQVSNPAIALRAGVDRLMAFLGAENTPSDEALAAFLNAEIAPFFDFDHMARSAGGRLFERMDEAEQQRVANEIKRSFLTKMAEKLSGYSNQQVRFLPPRAANSGRTAQVSVAILNPGQYPSRLDFRLYRTGQQWRVYDVSANGQSAIVHYRQQMTRQVRERRMQQMRQMTPPARPKMPPLHTYDPRFVR